MPPVCFEFIKHLKPQLKDWIICFDSLGSSRCGYLSADTSIECKLKSVFGESVISNYKTLSQGEGMREDVYSDTTPPPNPLPQGAGERSLYNKVLISDNDKIIPTKSQVAFWGIVPNIKGGHCRFFQFRKWSDLL